MTPFTLPCPECRADMDEVSHYPLDSDTPAETYFWCINCGHEEVYTTPRIASDMDDADDDIDPRDLAAIRRDMDRQIYKQLDAEDRGEYIEDYPDDADTEPQPLDDDEDTQEIEVVIDIDHPDFNVYDNLTSADLEYATSWRKDDNGDWHFYGDDPEAVERLENLLARMDATADDADTEPIAPLDEAQS